MEPRTAAQFAPGVIDASRAVLVELGVILRSYLSNLALIGGWAPYFLLQQHQQAGFDHVGSIDIDLAVHPRIAERGGYASIAKLIAARGYEPPQDELADTFEFRYDRRLVSPYDQKPYTIRVDFLTLEAGDSETERRHRTVQPDLKAFKASGCELAFDQPVMVELTAKLPDAGGEATVQWPLANLAASLVMKSLALGGRYKEKDAYDLFYLVRHYQQGPTSAAEALRPLLHLPVVQQARKNLQEAFGSLRATGPAWVANFNDLTKPRARDILIADVYKTFERFFQLLS